MWESLEQVIAAIAGTDEGSATNESEAMVVGHEGLWLLGLCIFDFAIGGLAAALCLLSSLTTSPASQQPPNQHAARPVLPSRSPANASNLADTTPASPSDGATESGTTTTQSSTTSPSSISSSSLLPPSSASSARRRTSYIHPLQIVEDFRDRWRTRWRHQQYFEVVTYHNGEQYEVKNFRPVKNAFVQQRPGRMEHEISVSDYKRHCEMAKKIVGYESLNDFKIKNPSVVYRNYFRLRGASDDAAPTKPAKTKKTHHKHSSAESSPHDATMELQSGPKRCTLSCTLCGRNFDYVSRYLVTPQPSTSGSTGSDLADGVPHHMKSN